MRETLLCLLVVALLPASALAQADDNRIAQDLKRLTLEQLGEVDVTTVSRRSERLSDVTAAVSVVTGEDVRRSGATTLAEAMRLADALDVVRVHGNAWAVSARGFTITTANKLLVLIDGRTIYSPLFSGTFWDAQDMLLADVDRIEVVRGPGGATWGANAVNGVINVISKPAAATRGTFALVTAGTLEHFIGSVRHGGRFGRGGSYRVYGKVRDRGAQLLASGGSAGDTFRAGQGGFRLESAASGARTWFVQGDVYRGWNGLLEREDADIAGGNVLGQWTRRFSGSSEVQLQGYYDRTFRHVPGQFKETRDTADAELLHRRLAGRHHFVAGGSVRVSDGRDIGASGFRFDPERRTNTLIGLFAQDEITVRPAHVFVTLGSKFERNDFTGFEVQPTARLRVTLSGRQTAWAAVSRAVRLPTRFDTDLRLVNPATGAVTLTGSESFDGENVLAYEAGYRVRPHPRISLDAAAFVNRYNDLRSQELPGAPGQPIVLANMLNASTAGFELGARIHPTEGWRIQTSYAYLHRDFSVDQGSRDPFDGMFESNDPAHLFSARSMLDLPYGLELDAMARVIGPRPAPTVEGYGELDLRLGWTVRPGWDVSLVGQNLLHARHAELFSTGSPRYAMRRGVYIRTTWHF